jgi:hypothetical protein
MCNIIKIKDIIEKNGYSCSIKVIESFSDILYIVTIIETRKRPIKLNIIKAKNRFILSL